MKTKFIHYPDSSRSFSIGWKFENLKDRYRVRIGIAACNPIEKFDRMTAEHLIEGRFFLGEKRFIRTLEIIKDITKLSYQEFCRKVSQTLYRVENPPKNFIIDPSPNVQIDGPCNNITYIPVDKNGTFVRIEIDQLCDKIIDELLFLMKGHYARKAFEKYEDGRLFISKSPESIIDKLLFWIHNKFS